MMFLFQPHAVKCVPYVILSPYQKADCLIIFRNTIYLHVSDIFILKLRPYSANVLMLCILYFLWLILNVLCTSCLHVARVTDYKSAFTATHPASGATSGTIKFNNFITNIGGHYDTSAGQFTCKYPGIYVFSLHIYKHPAYDYAQCYIRMNKANVIFAHTNPHGNNYEYTESSNSVILHLKQGDKVDLGDCSSASYMWDWTSFSGFLLNAD